MKRSWRCVVVSVLWLAWLGLLPGTFVAAMVTGQGGWSRFWWMSSAVLVAAAWVHWSWRRRGRLAPACALIACGITLGMLADLYGACRALRFTEPLTMIVPLFALGHVGYVAGCLMAASRLGLTARPRWRGTLAGAVALYNLAGPAICGASNTAMSGGRSVRAYGRVRPATSAPFSFSLL